AARSTRRERPGLRWRALRVAGGARAVRAAPRGRARASSIALNALPDRGLVPWHAPSTMARAAARHRLVVLLLLAALIVVSRIGRADATVAPLAAEIARLDSFLRSNRSNDELWADVKASSEPALARTRAALDTGRRWLALQRLAPVSVNLDGSA